jgi:hypothetical protein
VLMETGQLFAAPAQAGPSNAFFVDFPADRLPCVAASLPFLMECDFDEQFEFGLDLMIEGLRAKTST